MTDRFPLIINSEDQQIQELSSGDKLDLTGSGVAADVFTVDTNSEERLRIDSLGNVLIGGITQATADIALNADGTATFASYILTGPNTGSGSNNATGMTIDGRTGRGQLSIIKSEDDAGALGKGFLTFITTDGTPTVKANIASDGSATFAGAGDFGNRIAVTSGGFAFVAKETSGGTNKGALMNTGEFRIGPDVTNTNTLTARINSDGSATFASYVESDLFSVSRSSVENKDNYSSKLSIADTGKHFNAKDTGGTTVASINADGSATFAGIGSFGSDLYIGGNLNVVGDVLYDEVNGRNLNISGISTTQNLEVLNHTSLNTLNVSGVSTFANNIFCNGDISLPDHTRIALGDNNDLQIRHSGSHSIISDTGTGNLNINASRLLVFDSTAVEYLASFTENGPVELYYDSFKKFETTATGIDVTGHIETDTLNVSGISTTQNLEVSDHTSLNTLNVSGVSTFTSNIFVGTGATVGFGSTAFFRDNAKAIFGNGGDLAIHHGGGPSGEASYIDESGTGKLYIRSNSLSVKGITADEPIASFIEDGSVELFYDATKRFETTSDGIDVTGHIETDTLNVSGISTFNSTVNVKTSLRLNGPNDQTDLYIGSSNQVKLDHNGSSAFWINEIGSSYIRGAAGFIVQKEGDGYDDIIKGIADGAVELYYDNVKKFETTSDGIDVTGHIETDTLNVSGGSSLTNQLEIRSDDATPARIDFYCEVNNLHRVRLKSPLHSEFSGNPDVVLPNISGNLLVGDTASPISQDLNTTGVITAQDFDALSDINFKENIQTVDNALNKVMSLRGVSFDWKKSKQPSFGVIAQEIEEVFPDLVHGESPKTVNYNGLVSVLIESIKDMKREITSLNEEVQSLKKSIMN